MTIIGVGKAVPSQLYLMQLAGLVIVGRRKVDDPSDQEIAFSKQEGHRALCRMTGQDFGHDVERWYEYLIISDYALTHPYGYGTLRQFLKHKGYNVPFKKDVIEKLKASQSHTLDNAEVQRVVPKEDSTLNARIFSPHLVQPQQVADFMMEVDEVASDTSL